MRAQNCLRCGRSYSPTSVTQKYCSTGCYDAALSERRRRPRQPTVCARCGTTFEAKRVGSVYCGVTCRVSAYRAAHRQHHG